MQIRLLAIVASFVVLLSSQVFGQARVVEAGGGNAPAQSTGNNDLVMSLYNQLEALQQEVQTLRGLVEEQGNQIRRMQTEQRDRYLDIDRRLSELPAAPLTGGVMSPPGVTNTLPPSTTPSVSQSAADPASVQPLSTGPQGGGEQLPATSATEPLNNGATSSASVPTTAASPPQSAPTTTGNANSSTLIGAASASPQDEQELYRNALRLLLEEDNYVDSIRMLQAYIDSYPQGRLLTNTLYWQGEAYLAIAEFTMAEAVFTRLLTQHPDDPKAAGAYLKLGKVYEGQGDKAKAEEIWQQLPSRYPDSANEIVLARDYLQNL